MAKRSSKRKSKPIRIALKPKMVKFAGLISEEGKLRMTLSGKRKRTPAWFNHPVSGWIFTVPLPHKMPDKLTIARFLLKHKPLIRSHEEAEPWLRGTIENLKNGKAVHPRKSVLDIKGRLSHRYDRQQSRRVAAA